MDRTSFYVVFIPGLALATLAVSFAFSAFALTQGPFKSTTKRGLLSLSGVLVVIAALFLLAFNFNHPALPAGGPHAG